MMLGHAAMPKHDWHKVAIFDGIGGLLRDGEMPFSPAAARLSGFTPR